MCAFTRSCSHSPLYASSSPYSSSNSPSSSAVASWYCWYSDTRSFMLDSASVNSISSIPSPGRPWRKALRRNMPVNCSETRFHSSWMAGELPMKIDAIFRPLGGMSQTEDLILLGIHSTKYEEFLFWTFSICSSTSLVDIRPRNRQAAVKYRPWRGSAAHIMFLASNICWVSSGTVSARYCCEPRDVNHEEVEAGEGHDVDGELAQVAVELAGEAQRARDARHDGRHKVVEVAEGRGGELQSAEADVVQGLVVDAEALVSVLDKLVHRQGGVVGLHDRVRHLGRGHDGEGRHDAVRVLLADLGGH